VGVAVGRGAVEGVGGPAAIASEVDEPLVDTFLKGLISGGKPAVTQRRSKNAFCSSTTSFPWEKDVIYSAEFEAL
jgi:hypothetical protein